jgi:hypothetical protein
MRRYTIEVSEPIYQLLHQQASTQNSSLENILERLLVATPESNITTAKENIQLEIIKLYSTQLEYQELLDLKQILANFFAHKAIKEADKIWDEHQLSVQTMESWLDEA